MGILEGLADQGLKKAAEVVVAAIPAAVLRVFDNDELVAVLDDVAACAHAMHDKSNDEKKAILVAKIREEAADYSLEDRMVDLLGDLIYNKFRIRLEF